MRVVIITILLLVIKLVVADFANPNLEFDVPVNSQIIAKFNSAIYGWSTNNPYGLEVWGDGYNGEPADTPNNFIELNAFNNYDDIFQTLTLKKFTDYKIEWKMQARTTISQQILLLLNSVNVHTYDNTDTSNWVAASYVFNTGITTIWEIQFQGVSENPALGNYIDSIHISETVPNNSLLCYHFGYLRSYFNWS